MAGHGKQRQIQAMGHVLDEAGLTAAGRALDQHRHAVLPGLLEQHFFVAQGLIERRSPPGIDFDDFFRRIHDRHLTGIVHACTLPAGRYTPQAVCGHRLIAVK